MALQLLFCAPAQSMFETTSPEVRVHGSWQCRCSSPIRKHPTFKRKISMDDVRSFAFTPPEFPSQACHGRHMIDAKPKQALFVQGDQADAVFYILSGRTKLTVVSREGKKATITFLSAGDFAGEESLFAAHAIRPATATAVDDCTVLKISKEDMIRKIHCDPGVADTFVNFLLARTMKTQADLIDQIINSSEKRLARILLLMAEFDNPGGNDWNHTFSRLLLHEPLSQAWIH
jgi:CRP-like cAMP-binding protein